jgi:hypothetical protein
VRDRLRTVFGELPASPVRRAGVIVALVVGGIVALLVPVFFAVMLFGLLGG